MTKTSRILSVFLGVSLAFLVGLAAMAAQDAAKPEAQAQAPAAAQPMPGMPGMPGMSGMHGMGMGMGQMTYAPGLPGWINHLPADKQEAARKIWLTDGRNIVALREMMKAKRFELSALEAMPTFDEKAAAALVKEIASYEEKLLTAEIAFDRKLEKEGIPAWGHGMGMMGEGGMMEKGEKCGMMGSMGGMGGMMGGMGSMGKMDMGQKAPAQDKAPAEKPAEKHNM